MKITYLQSKVQALYTLGKQNRHSTATSEADALIAAIKEARQNAGLSQREVARRMKFHPTVWGKIERGERVLDVIEFVALASALDINPHQLLDAFLAVAVTPLSAAELQYYEDESWVS